MIQEDIQKQGAVARTSSLSRVSNPFLSITSMPVSTGETLEEWEAKVTSWDIGWLMEDLLHN